MIASHDVMQFAFPPITLDPLSQNTLRSWAQESSRFTNQVNEKEENCCNTPIHPSIKSIRRKRKNQRNYSISFTIHLYGENLFIMTDKIIYYLM
uniref:Uncharacterized protein n=1 Tax=Pararge aegeria TaxID=116150 RepID=S4P4Z2_9NEOP